MGKALRQIGKTIIIMQICSNIKTKMLSWGTRTEEGTGTSLFVLRMHSVLRPTADIAVGCGGSQKVIQSVSKRFTYPTENLQPQEEVLAISYLLWNLVEIIRQVKKVPGRTDRLTDAPAEHVVV